MRDSGTIDETDLAIIHALERAPRAPWAMLASLIRIDAGTAARRWQRLEESGIAWVTCYPLLSQTQMAAVVEISCTPGTAASAAQEISKHPHALFVDLLTGSSDILVTVLAENRRALSDFVIETLGGIAGVISVHPHPIVGMHADRGFSAITESIAPQIVSQLPVRSSVPVTGLVRHSDDIDWQICLALSEDGRRPFSELAALTGISEASVRRRMTRLTDEGALRLMVEIAADAAPASNMVWYRMRVAPKKLVAAAEGIAKYPNIKAIVSVAGPSNLIVKASFRQLAAMGAFEATLNHDHPAVEITDRNVVLRPIRLMGRFVDAEGFATGLTSIDIRESVTA